MTRTLKVEYGNDLVAEIEATLDNLYEVYAGESASVEEEDAQPESEWVAYAVDYGFDADEALAWARTALVEL